MKFLALGLFGIAAAISVNETAYTNYMVNVCEPVTYCDGQWVCEKGGVPINHPKYGIICHIENGVESFSVGMSEMCPLGGSVTTDFMCQMTRQAPSWGCPDFTETIQDRATTTSQECLIKYPIFCPKGYVYFNEYRSCRRFEKAECHRNTTECGKYYCRDGTEPIYLDYSSNKWPMCVNYKYVPQAKAERTSPVCNSDETLIEGECVAFYDALYVECPTQSPSPKDSPSYSPDCFKWVCDREVEPTYTELFNSPICIYNKYDAVANSTGYLNCPNGGTLWQKICVVYTSPYKMPCNNVTEYASTSPYPSNRIIPSQSSEPIRQSVSASMTPYPSNRIIPSQSSGPIKPSEVTYPTRDVPSPSPFTSSPFTSSPCFKWMCDREVEPTYTSLFDSPICIYNKYDAVANSTGYLNCPNGGTLWQKYCVVYTNAFTVPCDNITVSVTPTPSSTLKQADRASVTSSISPTPSTTLKQVDRASVTSSISPTPSTTLKQADRASVTASVTPSRTHTSKPIETPSRASTKTREAASISPTQTVIKSCDKYYCPDGMTPMYISNFREPVCIYRRYGATKTADGVLGCENGGVLVGDECILYEAAIYVPCSVTPVPVEKPSDTPRVGSTISATITIEIRGDVLGNSTRDLSVFEDKTVLLTLREAIAKALNVAVDMVVIESLSWIENGNIKSVIHLDNQLGGRELQDVSSLNIKYKVVNAPEGLMALSSEEFATMVESSGDVSVAAATVVSVSAGMAVGVDSIAVQSTAMSALQVNSAQSNEGVSSDGQSYSMIGGIVAGAAFVVGVSAFMIVKKRRTNRNKLVKKGDIESNGIMDRVTVVNPVVVESANVLNNSSKREMNNSFSPVRRILI